MSSTSSILTPPSHIVGKHHHCCDISRASLQLFGSCSFYFSNSPGMFSHSVTSFWLLHCKSSLEHITYLFHGVADWPVWSTLSLHVVSSSTSMNAGILCRMTLPISSTLPCLAYLALSKPLSTDPMNKVIIQNKPSQYGAGRPKTGI